MTRDEQRQPQFTEVDIADRTTYRTPTAETLKAHENIRAGVRTSLTQNSDQSG